ncbi:MAG: hypothetical protein R6V06_07655 [Kiritimatiellia bacterium]
MKHSITTGIAFGLTSGIITTVGLMVGLNSGTHSRIAVIGGVITIAVADACSDALGIHVSEESKNIHSDKEIWISTLSTFFSKFICALSFLVPLFIFELSTAIWINSLWGISLLGILSYIMAKAQKKNPVSVISEHIGVAVIVIFTTCCLGKWIAAWSR